MLRNRVRVSRGVRVSPSPNPNPDPNQALRLARLNALAGACTALGLRFAGSCCEPACQLLMAQAKQLHAQRQATGTGAKAAQPTLETCTGTVAIALGMVMAGSGNLDCLRLFRVLRRRVDSEALQCSLVITPPAASTARRPPASTPTRTRARARTHGPRP